MRRPSTVRLWILALLPIVLIAGLVWLVLTTDPAAKLRGDLPPVELLAFERVVLSDDGITATILNDGPDPVSIAQVQGLDWDAIDLSEWIEILMAGDVLPDGYAEMEVFNAIERTTVDNFAETPDVPDGLERTASHFQDPEDPDTAREAVRQELWTGQE